MDTIIEHILQFLQFDLASLFGTSSDCCVCRVNLTKPPLSRSMERRIRNVYEPRPRITDGSSCEMDYDSCLEEEQEEEDCDCPERDANCNEQEDAESEDERQLACIKQEQSAVCAPDDECGDCQRSGANSGGGDCLDADNESNVCTCDLVCKQLVARVTEKCSSATLLELQCIEERATKLWETLNAHLRTGNTKCLSWWDLKSWQKLPFYWAALSNEILCEDPFDNFKRFYSGNGTSKPRKRGLKRQNERMLILWHRLNCKQRLPFIMESFISKLGAGKVSICDEREIQRVIAELQNK